MLSVFDQGRFAPCPAPFNMAAHVLAAGRKEPAKVALSVIGPGRREDWSFGRLTASVGGIARGLTQRGLKAGDIVLLRLGNTPETPLAYLGCIAAGLVPVPTSSQLTEAETAGMIAELSPALILHDPSVPCPDHPARCDLADLQAMVSLAPLDPVMGDPDRPAYMVYTSGTSGQPRAVVHAHRAIWARGMMIRDWYDLHGDDRMLHAGAFNWTYTMGTGLMDPWSVGATALIPQPETRPEDLPALICEHRATIFAAAPGVYRKFLAGGPEIAAPALRHGLSAGEKLSPGLRAAWEQATGCAVHEAFGMSECSTFISASPHAPALGNALGQPQPGRRVAVVDADGCPVARGTPGILAVDTQDPGLMIDYFAHPEDAKDRRRNGWFLTGDQGVMRDDDQIEYLGRADDMMNAGGYRVSPLEVETAFADFPGVESLAVTEIEARADARIIVAFYTAPHPASKPDMRAHAAARLAGYKQPRDYIHVEELPAGPNGKLKRGALKSMWRPDD